MECKQKTEGSQGETRPLVTSFDLLHKPLLETSPSSRLLRVLDYANEFYLDFL